jgi:hypothetical protein
MADGRWSYRFSPLLSHQVTCRRNSSSTRWATRPCTMSASSNPASPIPEVVRCVPCALPLLGRRARRRTPSTATPSSAANRPAPHQPLRAVESLRPPSSHAAACASLRAVTTAEAFSISSAESVATQLSAPGDGTLADATPQPPPLHPGACRSAMPSRSRPALQRTHRVRRSRGWRRWRPPPYATDSNSGRSSGSHNADEEPDMVEHVSLSRWPQRP